MSEANFISDAEKAEHLPFADGKGVKRVSAYNDGVQVNIATEETLQAVLSASGGSLPYDSVSVDTSNPTSIVITKLNGATVVDTKTINII